MSRLDCLGRSSSLSSPSEVASRERAVRPSSRSVVLAEGALYVDGAPRILRGGTIQWFRLAESLDAQHLDRFVASGMNTVDLYVPWADMEPEAGRFDEALLARMKRFMDRAHARGLFVYFRPGPYTCNERDGGSIPSRLRPTADKRSSTRDGNVAFRSADPDWLGACDGYLSRLFQEIRPYLKTQGGPIVLVALENEFDYAELFSGIDKLFRLDGRRERGFHDRLGSRAYMARLAEIAKRAGVDVPLTTCPGQIGLKGTGGVIELNPFPNNYDLERIEARARTFIDELQDRNARAGVASRVPTGMTESLRTVTGMKRALFGGMKAYFAFNAHGFAQEGYRNTIILDPEIKNHPLTLRSPRVGYMGGALDYYGTVSPNGTPREKFYNFRRANMFLESFESALASASRPRRAMQGGLAGLLRRPEVRVANARIGARDRVFGRSHYVIETVDGTRFISLLNDGTHAQTIPVHGISVGERTLPRHAPLVIPTEVLPPGAPVDRLEGSNVHVLLVDHAIAPGLRLGYSTSELVHLAPFGDRRLMVVAQDPGTTGEILIDQLTRAPALRHVDSAFTIHQSSDGELVMTVSGDSRGSVVIETAEGEKLQILSLPRRDAGRLWFFEHEGRPLVVGPVDLATLRSAEAGRPAELELEHESSEAPLELMILGERAPRPRGLALSRARDPETLVETYAWSVPVVQPAIDPDLLSSGRWVSDRREADRDFDDSSWGSWNGAARTLDALGFYEGHAWYRATLDIPETAALERHGSLFIEGASDFVGVYVNGHYLSTLAPLGTRIENMSRKPRYRFESAAPHLVHGRNVLAFRTETWGHAAFPAPQGHLAFFPRVRLPAVSLESERGLEGGAWLGGRPLSAWKVRAGLGGELEDPFTRAEVSVASLPLELEPGAVGWYETRFDTSDLPSEDDQRVSLALTLEGHDAKATIWLNGALVGRWLSDADWLRRSNWANPTRTLFSSLDPDQIPLPHARLIEDGENLLRIAFEDASSSSGSRGRIDRLAVTPLFEERGAGSSGLLNRPILRARAQFPLETLEA